MPSKSKKPNPSATQPIKIDVPPPPFVAVPALQSRFTTLLRDRKKVYLTHIDANPKAFKRHVFAVPVILNLFFTILLLWRLRAGIPWYIAQLQTLVQTMQTMQRGSSLVADAGGWRGLLVREARVAATVLVDYVLFTVVAPWPASFFVQRGGSAFGWRLRNGFADREVVVRESRGWEGADVLGGRLKGLLSPFWLTRVLPYVEIESISKTAYLLMDANWDLQFGIMSEAQQNLGAHLKESDLNGKVWAWWPVDDDKGAWVMWDFARELYASTGKKEHDLDDKSSDMSEKFRNKLTEMGKEDLFWKWAEMIHFETTKPGGFTKERQQEVGHKVKALFVEYDVDFDQFAKDTGINSPPS